ncbi:MAG TPA: hypothetical protein VJ461_03075 [Candidatus Nanoarchaeia archaeon]|nr:hypothetical protein [Candidatus Nanoarchaeia archaeon]
MEGFELFKKKKKEKELGKETGQEPDSESDLFEKLEIDTDSDLPVHEEFVDSKKLRKVKK